MPWGVAAGVLGSVAGSAISSAMSPSSSASSSASGGGSNLYTPTGLSSADQTWQSLLSNMANQYNANNLNQYGLGSLWSGIQAGQQYSPGLQNAANSAAGGYQNLANLQGQYAGTLNQQASNAYGTQQNLLNAGQQVYNTALDPQNALYNQLANQQMQQSGATNSMYGLGSSGVGAGIANQNQQNFDINWQNQQLARQATGLGAYTNAAGQGLSYGQLGNADLQGVTNMLSNAQQNTLLSGQLPYATAQGIAALPGQLANTYGSFLNQNVYQPGSALQSQIIPYLNYGQGATSNAFNAASQGAGALGSAVSQGISGLGTAAQNAGGFGNLFGGTTGSFGGGDFSGAFTSNPYYSGGGNSYGFTM